MRSWLRPVSMMSVPPTDVMGRPDTKKGRGLSPRGPRTEETNYREGLTCTSMKLPWALVLMTWMVVPVFGALTPASGVTGDQ